MKDGDLFRWYYNNEIEYRLKLLGKDKENTQCQLKNG